MFTEKELNEFFKDFVLCNPAIDQQPIECQESEIQTILQKWNTIPNKTWEDHQTYRERLLELRPSLYDVAIQGNAHAQYVLYCLDIRMGNSTQAIGYLTQSALQGFPQALDHLSQEYQDGYHVKRNLSISKLLCIEAMKKGNQDAEFKWKVARFTESYFQEPRNFRLGLENAVKLKDTNERVSEFIKAYQGASREALHSDDDREESDYNDLKEVIGWRDENSSDSDVNQ